MNKLALDFENFISTRIEHSQIQDADRVEYEAAMGKISKYADVADIALKAMDITERSAYLHGLHDGLSIMAMFDN